MRKNVNWKNPPEPQQPEPPATSAAVAWSYVKILRQINAAPHVIEVAEREAQRLEEEEARSQQHTRHAATR